MELDLTLHANGIASGVGSLCIEVLPYPDPRSYPDLGLSAFVMYSSSQLAIIMCQALGASTHGTRGAGAQAELCGAGGASRPPSGPETSGGLWGCMQGRY